MGSKGKSGGSKRPTGTFFGGFAYAMWCASTLLLAGVLYVFGPWFVRFFGEHEITLPGSTHLAIDGGRLLHTPVGAAVLAGVLLVGSLPAMLGARGSGAAKLYGAGALLFTLAAGGAYYATVEVAAQLGNAMAALPW